MAKILPRCARRATCAAIPRLDPPPHISSCQEVPAMRAVRLALLILVPGASPPCAPGADTNGDGNATVPAVQDWGSIVWPSSAPSASLLNYCDIRYGGYSQAGILIFQSSSQTVTNSFIRRGYFGIDCQGTAAPTIS